MTRWLICLLAVCSLVFVGCKKDAEPAGSSAPHEKAPSDTQAAAAPRDAELPSVLDRKIVRTAELEVRTLDPVDGLERAKAIAERFGGHVVSSSSSNGSDRVVATLKVRADRFDAALTALKQLGTGPGTETVSTQDVTEEYVDLDARLRTQKRLEEQLLTILKDAKSVSETLDVHRQLATTRTEIERLEGRKRLMDSQVSLSTINLRFERDEPLLAVGGGRFRRAAVQAGADIVNVGALIVIGTVRLLGVLIPVTLLVLLPLGLCVRWTLRRLFRRHPPARAAA